MIEQDTQYLGTSKENFEKQTQLLVDQIDGSETRQFLIFPKAINCGKIPPSGWVALPRRSLGEGESMAGRGLVSRGVS